MASSRQGNGGGRAASRLRRIVDQLTPFEPAHVERDVWHLILLENLVYLADDEARGGAFAALRELTGLDEKRIARCPDELLEPVCAHGRMAAKQVAKLRTCAALFAELGDPRELVQLPRPAAKKALKRFPGIGDPGFDKLRAFAGVEPVLAVDSNGLRVLLRLGYGTEAKAYAQSYRSAVTAAREELPDDCDVMVAAFVRLRELGRTTCRNSAPQCAACVLRRGCPTAK